MLRLKLGLGRHARPDSRYARRDRASSAAPSWKKPKIPDGLPKYALPSWKMPQIPDGLASGSTKKATTPR